MDGTLSIEIYLENKFPWKPEIKRGWQMVLSHSQFTPGKPASTLLSAASQTEEKTEYVHPTLEHTWCLAFAMEEIRRVPDVLSRRFSLGHPCLNDFINAQRYLK